MKVCTQCNIAKEFSFFHKDKQKSDGLTSFCKECRKLNAAGYYQNNKEKVLLQSKQWRTENKERYVESTRQYNKKYRLETCEQRREYDKERAKVHKGYFAAKTRKRYAAKLRRTPPWLSKNQLKQIQIEYDLAAWASEVMGFKYHVDHIVPLQGKHVCGLHVPWNLQVIPATDNIKKGNRI
jgi:hypothetical protein